MSFLKESGYGLYLDLLSILYELLVSYLTRCELFWGGGDYERPI